MRKKKWLRRGAYLLVALALLYALFCWALFNPLEGSMEKLEVMVPEKVTYFLHGPWAKVRESALFQRHAAGSRIRDRVIEELGRDDGLDLDHYLLGPIREIEEQVNASLPGFLGRFSIADDIAGREIVLAGTFSRHGEDIGTKVLNSPFLILTRISYRSRFLDVLDYEFVRNRVPGLRKYRDFYEYDVGEQRIRAGAPEEARYFYFARARDVLLMSNDRELMDKAVHLSRLAREGGTIDEALPRNFWFYYDVQGPGEKPGFASREPGVTCWVRVANADSQLGNELEEIGREPEGMMKDFVRALFPVGSTTTSTLHLGLAGEETITLGGKVRMVKQLPRRLQGIHQYEGADIPTAVGSIAKLLPVESTFGVAYLSMDPREFILNMFPALDPATRALYLAADPDGGGWDVDGMAGRVGDWFEDGVGLAWARLPEADDVDLDTWDGGTPSPLAAMSLFLTEKENLGPDDLIDFFRRNAEKFGFRGISERSTPVGRLFKCEVTVDRGLMLFQPGFALLDHQFVFSTNIGELSRMLEAANGGGPALADGPRFKAAMRHARGQGNIFLYADVVRQREFVLDQRWQWAFDETNYNAVDFRNEVLIRLNKEHPDWKTKELQEEADREVEIRDRHRQDIEFPEAIQAYRDRMFWFWPFEWLALSARVAGDGAGTHLALKGAVRLREATEEK